MESGGPSAEQIKAHASQVPNLLKKYNESQGWKLSSDKPFELYSMEIDGGMASKGITVVNFPIDQVAEFISRPGTQVKLNPDCVKDENLEVGEGYKVIYLQYKAPWPVAWRDFVCVTKRHEEEGKIYFGTRSCNYKHPEQNKIVRAEVIVGGWILEKIDENSTKVIYISNADIKGSIPAMVKNTLSKNSGSVVGKVEELMKKEKESQ